MKNPGYAALLQRAGMQPLIAAPISLLAVSSIAVVWWTHGLAGMTVDGAILAVVLAGAVVAGYQFPVHVGPHHKVEMSTVPLYLLVVLAPSPALAATAAFLGMLAAEWSVRSRRGNYYSDVITSAARWALVALLASSVMEVATRSGLQPIACLLIAVVVMWVGTILTYPFIAASVRDEPLGSMLVGMMRESSGSEGAQYTLGLLGALGTAEHEYFALALLLLPAAIVYVANKNVLELRTSTRQLLQTMADAVDLRDAYTGGHSRRVSELASKILTQMEIYGEDHEMIVWAARVHDIGKLGLPDEILNKPGVPTDEERATIATHPQRGADLLKRHREFAHGLAAVRHHHERWDGRGYPSGLKGTQIPFGARVIAVADAYDAMTSDRPYRTARTHEQALTVLAAGAGRQWDPSMVGACIAALAREGEPEVAPDGPAVAAGRLPLASPGAP